MTDPGLTNRLEALSKLGEIMIDTCRDLPSGEHSANLRSLAVNQYKSNSWFTESNVLKSIYSLGTWLNKSSLSQWLEKYDIPDFNDKPKTIGLIMAGNIPLVAFHDFLCVLISGNILVGKTSSKDTELIVEVVAILCALEPKFKDYIFLNPESLKDCDAIIATGSNNSARYFEYHYGRKAHIFRKNRNSIAIIDADTSDKELEQLGSDVFDYYGLGCRNVSKLFLPEGFDIERLNKAWAGYSKLTDFKVYSNNYRYNKALLSVEDTTYYDFDFVLLKEDAGYSSPVAVVFFSYYKDHSGLKSEINFNSKNIQAIVGKEYIPFGMAQYPALNDYADGIDTLDFISNL